MKPYLLEEHDFYVKQINERVLAQFRDLNGDATRYAKAEYDRLLKRSGKRSANVESVAEIAHENAGRYYGLLSDLRDQVILGALAGLYHAWEKELRDFIERELMHDMEYADLVKIAWRCPIVNIFDLLTEFGWAVRAQPFFSLIDSCRLIVNVYKHGKGPSLEELKNDYPHYLRDPLGQDMEGLGSDYLDHSFLTVTEEHFTEIAVALRAFWEAFPEQLYRLIPVQEP